MPKENKICVNVLNPEKEPLIFEAVNKLGDENTKTLGFLAEPIFREYANKGWILFAVSEESQKLLGYLIYRCPVQVNMPITIVHLCVESSSRGKGIADALLKKLVDLTEDKYIGIKLSCRQEYEHPKKLWQRLGFHVIHEKPGRSKKGSILEVWFYSYGVPNLFSYVNIEDKVSAVIDTNIFLDFHDSSRHYHEQSLALLSDWFENEVELLVTPETFNDITDNNNPQQRVDNRALLSSFTKIDQPSQKLIPTVKKIKDVLKTKSKNKNIESDYRQLAYTILQKADFFITHDKFLLKNKDVIFENFKIQLVKPTQIILQIDELIDSTKLQPRAFYGSELDFQNVSSQNLDLLIQIFTNHNSGEKKHTLHQKLTVLVTNSLDANSQIETKLVLNFENKPYALVGTEIKNQTLYIHLLRVKKDQFILFRGLIQYFHNLALEKNCQHISIVDKYIPSVFQNLLKQLHFFRVNELWQKSLITAIENTHTLQRQIEDTPYSKEDKEILLNLTKSNLKYRPELEKIFFPLYLEDLVIPCYIIPIKARWAKELFDYNLATQPLFRANSDLLLNWMNVYYKSKNSSINAPARILWYVTDDKQYVGTKQIRASSLLENTRIDLPAKLHSKYFKYGVFGKLDILNTVKGNFEKQLMALEFSHTHVFSTPVSLKRFQNILHESETKGWSNQLMEISQETFLTVVKEGRKYAAT